MNPAPVPSPAPASPHKQAGTEEARSGINVVNTVSADTFRRMMQEMRGAQASGTAGASARVADGHYGPSAASGGGVAPAARMDDAPVADINAKYTFESFVAGDENRHAFNSAMRFAAFAEEPGQCPSLFIYGNSGLGKTHLLFAVRNYLAKEKPYIRVKYANSQAYLDDYMNELGTQRGPGSLIMREYRDADILIIDDVQNIVANKPRSSSSSSSSTASFARARRSPSPQTARPRTSPWTNGSRAALAAACCAWCRNPALR